MTFVDLFAPRSSFSEDSSRADLRAPVAPESSKPELVPRKLDKDVLPQPTKILLVGVGGAGCNTANRLALGGLQGVTNIAINTDATHLNMIRANRKILIGPTITHEQGCGGNPETGRMAAEESIEEIQKYVRDADIIFVSTGLGGGTGTGASPLIADVAKNNGAIVIGVVTTPFRFEGAVRQRIAIDGLEKLRNSCHTVVVIDNNRLRELYPHYSLRTAFELADEVIRNMVQSITDCISKPSLINVDYADFKTIVSQGQLASIGMGWSSTVNRSEEATYNALNSPLLDVTYEGISGAIVHVSGGEDMSLNEASRPGEIVSELMSDDALVIWGARIDPYLTSTVQVSLVLTGVEPKPKQQPLDALAAIPLGTKVEPTPTVLASSGGNGPGESGGEMAPEPAAPPSPISTPIPIDVSDDDRRRIEDEIDLELRRLVSDLGIKKPSQSKGDYVF